MEEAHVESTQLECKVSTDNYLQDSPHDKHVKNTHSNIGENIPKQSNQLPEHIETQHVPRKFIYCNQCDFRCDDAKSFVTHLLNVHSNNSEVIQCPHCEFKSIETITMDSHIENQHVELALLGHVTENQTILSQKFDLFKKDLTSALNGIIEGHNAMKQEFFILRQNNTDSNDRMKKIEEKMDDLKKVLNDQTVTEEALTKIKPTVPQPKTLPKTEALTKIKPRAPQPKTTIKPKNSRMNVRSDVKINNILFVGDSIAGTAHLPSLATAVDADIKLKKAYSSTYGSTDSPANYAPRFPKKNFEDVLANELKNSHYDSLLVQSGSVDITNLKTEANEANDHLEYFKQKTIVSAHNLVEAVSKAAVNHPELKKVVLMKQIPRYDSEASNPPGLKPYLSKLFNETLEKLCSSTQNSKIVLGTHNLDCHGGILEARYRSTQFQKFDGIHLYGPSGMKAYTASVLSILNSAQLVKKSPPKYYDQFEQAKYQAKQVYRVKSVQTKQSNKSNNYKYSVPTYNMFSYLDEHNIQGNY